jgi:hypothetical protein
MAFWDRNDARIPEKIRNLSPEDMEKMVSFYENNRDKISNLEAELAGAKKTLEDGQTQFNQQAEKIKSLEAAIAAQPKPVETPKETKGPTDWFENPQMAFEERLKPIFDYAMGSRAELAQMRLEQHLRDNPGKYGDNFKIYNKYRKEVVDLMLKEPLQSQQNPATWMNAFSLVKGFKDEEISEARKNNDSEFFGEATAKGVPPEEPKTDVIDDKVKENAKRWGVTPEQVIAARKDLTYDNEPAKGF